MRSEKTYHGFKPIGAEGRGATKHHCECALWVGGLHNGRSALVNGGQKAVVAYLRAIVNADKLLVHATFEDVYQLEIYLHFLARNLGNKGYAACFSVLKFGRSLPIWSAIVVKVDWRFVHINGFWRKFHAHFSVLCRSHKGRESIKKEGAKNHEKLVLLHNYCDVNVDLHVVCAAQAAKAQGDFNLK